MKHLLVCITLLVAVVYAKPRDLTFLERVDDRFTQYLSDVSKRGVNYPDGFYNKVCEGNDCCNRDEDNDKVPDNECANGSKCDDNAGDPTVSKYGYKCSGTMCGTGNNQYAGIFCDKDPKTVCDTCRAKHPNVARSDMYCYASNQTPMGYICLEKLGGGNYNALTRRELDVLYGEGTAEALEQIAREEAQSDEDKNTIVQLLRELLQEEE